MYIHTQQQMETAQERQGQSEKQHSKELTAFFFLMTVEAAVEAAGFARERGAALFVAAGVPVPFAATSASWAMLGHDGP